MSVFSQLYTGTGAFDIVGRRKTWYVAFGLLVALFGGIFTTRLLEVLGTPGDILADATRYARIMLVAMPGLFVFLLSTAMLRGIGDTLSPLFTLSVSTAIGDISIATLNHKAIRVGNQVSAIRIIVGFILRQIGKNCQVSSTEVYSVQFSKVGRL